MKRRYKDRRTTSSQDKAFPSINPFSNVLRVRAVRKTCKLFLKEELGHFSKRTSYFKYKPSVRPNIKWVFHLVIDYLNQTLVVFWIVGKTLFKVKLVDGVVAVVSCCDKSNLHAAESWRKLFEMCARWRRESLSTSDEPNVHSRLGQLGWIAVDIRWTRSARKRDRTTSCLHHLGSFT